MPLFGQVDVVEITGVDHQSVADDLARAFLDVPITHAGPGRAHAELAIDSPGVRKAGVHRVVEDRDVYQIVASFDLHADIHPHGALAFGQLVALARGVDYFAANAFMPWHS